MIPPRTPASTPLPALDEQLRRCWNAAERRRVWTLIEQMWEQEQARGQERRAS